MSDTREATVSEAPQGRTGPFWMDVDTNEICSPSVGSGFLSH